MATHSDSDFISAGEQINLLIQEGVDPQGKSYTLASAAAAAGISDQTLANLVHGKSQCPRLETTRALCHLYGISLDYFDLDTEVQCRAYLVRHRRKHASALVRHIATLSDQLSPIGKRNILTILHWIRSGQKTLNPAKAAEK